MGTSVLAASPAAVSEIASQRHAFMLETLHDGDDVIWGFDFLPDGSLLFSERGGKLFQLAPSGAQAGTLAAVPASAGPALKEISGVPAVFSQGQGGLLDLRVAPDFAKTAQVYLTYSEPTGEDLATTALWRGRLAGDRLLDGKRLFRAVAPSDSDVHFGSRVEWAPDGNLFLSVGERGERKNSQRLDNHLGKILRLTREGLPAPGNPFAQRKDALPEIWSFGHRNPQGLAWDQGTLWEAEFGPRGGDELNRVRPAANYGWPVVTFGKEYWGPSIGEGTAKEGMEAPVAHWTPSISPSALAVYRGAAFPAWDGNVFLACLSGTHLRRLELKDGAVVAQEELLKGRGMRFRNVRVGPQGFLYLSTDDGKILRLRPSAGTSSSSPSKAGS